VSTEQASDFGFATAKERIAGATSTSNGSGWYGLDVHNDDVNPERTVRAQDQRHFDVGGA
jgi:hypothetical protein